MKAIDELAPRGVGVVDWAEGEPLEALAAELGLAVRERRVLVPRERAGGRSLSAVHGLGKFPWHTDGAQRTDPPGWLLLRSLGTCRRPTLLLDGAEMLTVSALRSAQWLIEGDRGCFYGSVVNPRNGAIRWNPDVMRAVGGRAKAAEEVLARRLGTTAARRHKWRGGQALILDNRRWLHARPEIASGERRELERIHGDR
jgi:Taurine catabolism dioxygenase TauD, TfdA family